MSNRTNLEAQKIRLTEKIKNLSGSTGNDQAIGRAKLHLSEVEKELAKLTVPPSSTKTTPAA